jgi:hypothetical protein
MVVDVNRELYIRVVRQIITTARIYPICLSCFFCFLGLTVR